MEKYEIKIKSKSLQNRLKLVGICVINTINQLNNGKNFKLIQSLLAILSKLSNIEEILIVLLQNQLIPTLYNTLTLYSHHSKVYLIVFIIRNCSKITLGNNEIYNYLMKPNRNWNETKTLSNVFLQYVYPHLGPKTTLYRLLMQFIWNFQAFLNQRSVTVSNNSIIHYGFNLLDKNTFVSSKNRPSETSISDG